MNEYPTDEELQKIKEWTVGDFTGLCEYIYGIYNFDYGSYEYNLKNKDGVLYEILLTTGGWSGNEEIICAISNNYAWWAMYWESSQRGGKYVFRKND